MEDEGNKESEQSQQTMTGGWRAREVRCVGDCPNSGSHQRVMVASGARAPESQNTTGRHSHRRLAVLVLGDVATAVWESPAASHAAINTHPTVAGAFHGFIQSRREELFLPHFHCNGI